MEDRIVEIDRINTLNKGDKFLYNGAWRIVMSIAGGRVKFRTTENTRETVSANSQMFVEIERKQDIKPTKYEEDNLCTTTDHLR